MIWIRLKPDAPEGRIEKRFLENLIKIPVPSLWQSL
jgi:hypothetical protein